MGMLGLYCAGIWKRTIPLLAWVIPVCLANGHTTEEEFLDQLIFGDDAPLMEMPKPSSENTPSVSPPALPKPSKWDKDFSFRLDLGYADNVLLSPFAKDSSVFLRTSFDTFLYRPYSDKGFQTYLYVFGELNAYEDVESMDFSSLFMVQNELAWMGQDALESGLQLKYTFYDQVYDASYNEFDQASATVQANQFELRPFLRTPAGENGFVGAEFAGLRVLYEDSAEDHYETHIRIFLGRHFFHGSKIELELSGKRREYDERTQRDRQGIPLGGSLKRRSMGGGIQWTQHFSEHKLWSFHANAEFSGVLDNGLGYYDYNLSRGRISLARQAGSWKATVKLGWSRYDYKTQLGDDGSSKLNRATWETSLLLERSFGSDWSGFLEWQREQNKSNDRSYEYNANVVTIGGERSL